MPRAKRSGPPVVLGNPEHRHPGNLGKQLMDAVNAHNARSKGAKIALVARLCLRGLGDHADAEGWCFPGSEKLAAYCGATDKSISTALHSLMHAGMVGCITAAERKRCALPWSASGAPGKVPPPTAKLYLVRTIATPAARDWFERAQQLVGRAPPENPELARWAIAGRGEREALHLGRDIIAMVAGRELAADALVRAESMRESVMVRDVPAFAAAIPGPLLYRFHPAVDEPFTEAQCAEMVACGVLRVDRTPEAWLDGADQRVTLTDLPLVAAALAKRRIRVAQHENDDTRATG